MKQKIAVFSVLLAGILWGLIGIFVRKLTAAGLDSMQLVFLRSCFGSLILILFALIKDRSLLKFKWKDIWCFLGVGIAAFTFFNYCYFYTIKYTSLSFAAVMLYTAPSIVILLSTFLFKEKLTARKVVSVLFAFSGCVFSSGIFSGNVNLNFAGILLGLGSGFGYGLVTIFTRYAILRGYRGQTIVIYELLFSAICCVFLTDVRPVFKYLVTGPQEFIYGLLFVLVSTIMPNLLYTYGLTKLENGIATIIVSIEPVAATIVGAVVYKEKLGIYGILGIVCLCISFLILNLKIRKEK